MKFNLNKTIICYNFLSFLIFFYKFSYLQLYLKFIIFQRKDPNEKFVYSYIFSKMFNINSPQEFSFG